MVDGSANRRARESQTKERVRRWLESEGADYLVDVDLSPYKRTPYRQVDFVVLDPVPFAIEVRVPEHREREADLLRRMARRWLRRRITLAERYGRFLPLVVVSSEMAGADGTLPFVDAVFDANSLPPVRDLPSLVSLDPITQEVLRNGQPTGVEFTESEEALRVWSKSLTRDDLLRAEAFPCGTIAERLRRCARAEMVKPRRGQRAEVQSQGETLPGMAVTPQPEPEEEKRRDRRARVRALGAVRECLDAELEGTIVGELGGALASSHVPLPGVQQVSSALPVRTWQAPDGRHIMIRTYAAGGNIAFLKAQELFAEARMLRAFTPVPEGGLVLLLSIEATKQGFEWQSNRAARPIDPYLVNVLEEGGWKVFPWDFAERSSLGVPVRVLQARPLIFVGTAVLQKLIKVASRLQEFVHPLAALF